MKLLPERTLTKAVYDPVWLSTEDTCTASLTCWMMSQEIIKKGRQIEYFAYHIPRCKQDKDRVKLIAMAVVHAVHAATIVDTTTSFINDLNDSILTREVIK